RYSPNITTRPRTTRPAIRQPLFFIVLSPCLRLLAREDHIVNHDVRRYLRRSSLSASPLTSPALLSPGERREKEKALFLAAFLSLFSEQRGRGSEGRQRGNAESENSGGIGPATLSSVTDLRHNRATMATTTTEPLR